MDEDENTLVRAIWKQAQSLLEQLHTGSSLDYGGAEGAMRRIADQQVAHQLLMIVTTAAPDLIIEAASCPVSSEEDCNA